MNLVSQNLDQKATAKRLKIHRPYREICRKIVAYEVIVNANRINSEREITKLLNIPNSTMQTWVKKKDSKNAEEIELFFSSPAGSTLLQRIALAIIYNNKCGTGGIRGAQECLKNSGLDKYIASSTGALQEFWQRCEDCILIFGKQWEQKLAENMRQRKITVILDEMFRKRRPCLVAIEAISNYILLEKFTEDRTAETWKKELENVIKDFPVKVGQIVSDLCGAIRSLAKSYDAKHSPDIFHGQYEISKATTGAMSSQEKAAEKSLEEAEEYLKKITNKAPLLNIEKKKKQEQNQEEASKIRDILRVKYEEKKKIREETQEAKKKLGKIYHPIDLDTGQIQSVDIVKKKIEKQFEVIEKNVEKARLAKSSIDRVGKARRAFSFMSDYMNRFFIVFWATILDLQLDPPQEVFFKEVIFPLCYLNMIRRRFPKKEKEKLAGKLNDLQKRFQEGVWAKEFKEALMRHGKELAENFQRSSSCVEGRNGVLSLLMHRFHYLSEKTLKVLSIVHNFGVRRNNDGSTAAERFFEETHDDLFDYLVENVKIPGKPRLQIMKKGRQIA